MKLWLLFIAIGAATLGLRASFIMSAGQATSSRFDALRRFVPVAALTALVVPSLLPKDGEPVWARAVAGVLAAAIAWRSKNVLLTVIVGMAALLAAKAL